MIKKIIQGMLIVLLCLSQTLARNFKIVKSTVLQTNLSESGLPLFIYNETKALKKHLVGELEVHLYLENLIDGQQILVDRILTEQGSQVEGKISPDGKYVLYSYTDLNK